MRYAKACGIGLCLTLATPGFALSEPKSQTQSMSFEGCLLVIRNTAGELGVAPVNIVETSDLRIVRFPTADGSVLVTCSRPDQKMVITQSPPE